MGFRKAQARMLDQQLRTRDIRDERVIDAMCQVPRHEFVPRRWRKNAYDDTPLPLGPDQTISQPYIVAYMTEWLRPMQGERALDIGTGSGYQAAILTELGIEVFSIEIDARLSALAAKNLSRSGYPDVHLRTGDGHTGWPEAAPFDVILIAAATPQVPPELLDQLGEGGRMILPIGGSDQRLLGITRHGDRFEREPLLQVRFVPLKGLSEGR